MGIFTKLSAALKANGQSPDQVRSALTDAERLETEQSAEVTRLEAEKRALLTAGDAERGRNRNALNEARERREDARLYREELERRLATATADGDQVRRQAAYSDTKAKADLAAKALARDYLAGCQKILGVLRALSEAEAAISAVNEDLPAGAEPLASPEYAVRASPTLPRKVLSDELVERWCVDGYPRPLAEEYQSLVRASPDGTGARPNDQGIRYRKHRFRRVEFLPELWGEAPVPLTVGLRLPGLFAGPDIWSGSWGTAPVGAIEDAEKIAAVKTRPEPTRVARVECESVREAADAE